MLAPVLEIKGEIKKYPEISVNGNTTYQNLDSKSSSKMKFLYSNTGLPQEIRRSQINSLNFTSKGTRKNEQRKPKVIMRKEIIKIRAEVNEIETKKAIEKINETNRWFFEKIKLANF